jgi:methionyl-tRNA formyltransferase
LGEGTALRIIMVGTGGFAVPTFRQLIESPHQVLGLISKPVRPAHGRQVAEPHPMLEVARRHGVRAFQPASINSPEAADLLQDLKADLLVVCDYGQILRDEILALATLGGVNLHASLLPKYRGAAPINWALYHGERQTGVTVIHMTRRLDGGPCLVQWSTDIRPTETAPELELRLAELGAGAVLEAIVILEKWDRSSPLGEPQDATLATRARRLTKADGQIDWQRPAVRIFDHVRAMKPWPGTFTNWYRGTEHKLRLIVESVEVTAADDPHPGEIIVADRTGILVGTGAGAIRILRLQPAGKRLMTAEEFLRGHGLSVGDRLEE